MSKEQWIKENLKEGEHYAGIILGKGGELDYRLVSLPGEFYGPWDQAKEWAKSIGGELPTRREQSLLIANAAELFEEEWHWSGEQRAPNTYCAWMQDFHDGHQYYGHESNEYRARAVRRIYIDGQDR